MAAARKSILRSVIVLIALAGVLAGGWTAYMWHIYWNDSGIAAPVKDEAFKANKTVTITPIRANIYMLQGDGGNITALVGDEGVLIVDSDNDWMAPRIDAALKTLSDKPVRFVINTHFHHDHRGGNAFFRKQGAEIIAHENTRENMVKENFAAEPEPEVLPTITFASEYRLSFGGEDILLRHLPNAHTDGDIYVFFPKANVLATGDMLIYGNFPFISDNTHGTIDGHLASQRAMLEFTDADTAIVPGHGMLTGREGLAETSERLTSIRDYVALLKSAGIPRWYMSFFHPTYAWRGGYITDQFFVTLVNATLPE